jgi:AraC-like DNA-binding protein
MQGSSYLLLAPLQRQMELTSERSNPIRVHAGEFCLIDHARPYELTHGDQVRTLCVDIPRERLEACLPGAQRQIGRLVAAESAPARMLLAVLRALADEFSNASQVHLSPASGENVLGFIASAYADDDARASGRGMAARAGAFRVYVQARLRDPNLKVAEVAAYVGVSERYLRAVLETEGETFSSYLLRERLELCARLLSDASQRHRTITEIAFEAGFSNTSYFGQAFKERFGLTPRDYRKQN